MRFGYCGDCANKDCCKKCYRGSYYESTGARLYDYFTKREDEEEEQKY